MLGALASLEPWQGVWGLNPTNTLGAKPTQALNLHGVCAWDLLGSGAPQPAPPKSSWRGAHPGWPPHTYLTCEHGHQNHPSHPLGKAVFYRMVPYASFKCISFINHDLLKLWRVFIYLAEFPSCCLLCCAVMLWKDGWSFHFVDFIFFFLPGDPAFPLF